MIAPEMAFWICRRKKAWSAIGGGAESAWDCRGGELPDYPSAQREVGIGSTSDSSSGPARSSNRESSFGKRLIEGAGALAGAGVTGFALDTAAEDPEAGGG